MREGLGMKKSTIHKIFLPFLVLGFFLILLSLKAQIKPQKIKEPVVRRLPDLTVSIKCPIRVHRGQELGKSIKVVIKNKGKAVARDFFVDLVLSSDTNIPMKLATYSPNFHEDVLLKGGREKVKSLAPGASINLTLHGTNKIPIDAHLGTNYLGVTVDPGNDLSELIETNNFEVSKIEIHVCPAVAPITDCQIIEASGGTVGFARLRLLWSYGSPGVRPSRLLIIVYRFQGGTWDNIMPSEEPYEVESPEDTTVADVTIWRLFSGDYRIVFETYNCEGRKFQEFTFERQI